MRVQVAALALIAAAVACPAGAQTWTTPEIYGGLGYSRAHNEDGIDLDFNAVTGRVGARFNPYLALEAEVLTDTGDHSVLGGDVSLDYAWAVYAVGFYPVTQRIEVFARVGYGNTRYDIDLPLISDVDIDPSTNYGAGVQYWFDDRNGVRADYTYHDFAGEDGALTQAGISYVRRF